MRNVLQTFALVTLASGLAFAQDELPRFAFNLGAGFTTPTASAGERLDRGWNIAGAAGYRFHPNVSLNVDMAYNTFGINTATLGSLGFPDGNVKMWSATLNPVIHTMPRGPVDLYFTGGGGFYQWRQQFTTPDAATFTAFDPYFGVFYPVAVPVNVVVSEYTLNKAGFNGGAGLAFGTRWNAKFYAEARFHRMLLGANRHVDVIPVTFGFRW